MISIHWPSKVISVPRADMLLVQSAPTEIRELDVEDFRLALKSLEDDPIGMAYADTHRHNPPVTVGGVTLARVIEIVNGYTVTFEDGQYAVNIVGANSNIGDRVNVNQVSVRSANSAGLTQIRTVEAGAFGGVVALDVTHGYPGTGYVDGIPIGTHARPSNNVADAAFIAELRGIEVIVVHGEMVLTSGDDLSGYTIRGENAITTMVTIEAGANVSNCQFEDMIISNSVLDGYAYTKHCSVNNVDGIEGYVELAMLSGNLSLAGTQNTYFISCKSGCVGLGTADLPVLSMAGSGRHVAFRGYEGPIKITNSTDPDNTICIDVSSGATITIDPSCTAGNIYVGGIAHLPPTAHGMTVHLDRQLDQKSIADAVWSHASAAQMITRLAEAWGRLGLDVSKPLVTGQTSITFGDIAMALTGDATSTTVTRQ
ncbi:hypothetical protein [Malikia spinosa]|uniref:hypothetical protein n=1 Tax=Malikia spinosa TaxID=86180 RepID=UPI002FDA0C8C